MNHIKKSISISLILSLIGNMTFSVSAVDLVDIPQNNTSVIIPPNSSIFQNRSTEFSMKSIESKVSSILKSKKDIKVDKLNNIEAEAKNTKLKKLLADEETGQCGEELRYRFDGISTLTIYGSGDMFDYAPGMAPWSNFDVYFVRTSESSGQFSISSYAFSGMNKLDSVDLPTCTSIHDGAFSGCSSLSSINFPICRSIYDKAFSDCTNLSSIDLPNCTSIGVEAFCNCYYLGSISINLPMCFSVGDRSFYNCNRGLSSINLPKVNFIGESAFEECSQLKEVTFPNCIDIGDNAFKSCALTELNIPASVTSIGNFSSYCGHEFAKFNVNSSNSVYKSVDGVLFSKDGTNLIRYPAGKSGNITLPDSLTLISPYAFSGCLGLTSITIPNGVDSIGDRAFFHCSRLTSVTYEGTSDPGASSSDVFTGCSITVVNVPYNYQDSSFCGLPINRPEPTTEPTSEPSQEPTTEPSAEPTTEPTSEITSEEPTDESNKDNSNTALIASTVSVAAAAVIAAITVITCYFKNHSVGTASADTRMINEKLL